MQIGRQILMGGRTQVVSFIVLAVIDNSRWGEEFGWKIVLSLIATRFAVFDQNRNLNSKSNLVLI